MQNWKIGPSKHIHIFHVEPRVICQMWSWLQDAHSVTDIKLNSYSSRNEKAINVIAGQKPPNYIRNVFKMAQIYDIMYVADIIISNS